MRSICFCCFQALNSTRVRVFLKNDEETQAIFDKLLETYSNHIYVQCKKMLTSAEMSITQFGYECGFLSTSVLVRRLEAVTGKTPLDDRRGVQLLKNYKLKLTELVSRVLYIFRCGNMQLSSIFTARYRAVQAQKRLCHHSVRDEQSHGKSRTL